VGFIILYCLWYRCGFNTYTNTHIYYNTYTNTHKLIHTCCFAMFFMFASILSMRASSSNSSCIMVLIGVFHIKDVGFICVSNTEEVGFIGSYNT
jgi:hypothetical protein